MSSVYLTEDTPADLQPSDTPMEVCGRMPPPPPIPPWLRDTPTKLRHLVANCSCWKKFTDLCSLRLPSEYPQALFGQPQTDTAGTQWIPFSIALLMAAAIVIFAGVTYFLYQTKRLKLDFLDKQSGHNSQASGDPGYMTPSISNVSQLSACALDGDYFSSMLANDLDNKRSNNCLQGQGLPWHKSGEIILLPEKLMAGDMQHPFYVANIPGSDYFSSHSSPIDSDCAKLLTSTKQQFEMDGNYFGSDKNGHDTSTHAQFYMQKSQRRLNSNLKRRLQKHSYLEHSSYAQMTGVKGLVHRCGIAGASLIHSAAFWNRRLDHAPSKQAKSAPSFLKLRQSVYKMCTTRHFHTTSKRFQRFNFSNDASHMTSSDTVSHACSSTCVEGNLPTTSEGKDMGNGTPHHVGKRIGHVGHLLRNGRTGRTARHPENTFDPSEHIQVPTLTYVNEAFDSNHSSQVKLKRPTFRALKMSNVLGKIRSRQANRFIYQQ